MYYLIGIGVIVGLAAIKKKKLVEVKVAMEAN